jgi:hypothetical protein
MLGKNLWWLASAVARDSAPKWLKFGVYSPLILGAKEEMFMA